MTETEEATPRRRRGTALPAEPRREPPAWLPSLVKPFRREPISGRIETDEDSFHAELERAYQHGSKDVDAAWDRIREITTRGNAAGAVAALTLYGSQLFSSAPREPVFWVLLAFLGGLLAVLLRHFLVAWKAGFERSSHVSAVIDIDEQFRPPPILRLGARVLDWISAIALLGGGVSGLLVLYSLLRPPITP